MLIMASISDTYAKNLAAAQTLRELLLADKPPRKRAPFASALTRELDSPEAKERSRQLDRRVRERLGLPAKSEQRPSSIPQRQSAGRTTWKREIHMPMLPKDAIGLRGQVRKS